MEPVHTRPSKDNLFAVMFDHSSQPEHRFPLLTIDFAGPISDIRRAKMTKGSQGWPKGHVVVLWSMPISQDTPQGEYLRRVRIACSLYSGFTRNGLAFTPSQNTPYGEQTLGIRVM